MSEKSNVQHTISLLVNNCTGVLNRVALVFFRRRYNIDSVVVSPIRDLEYSRISLVVPGGPETLDQIISQQNKLVDVLHATDHINESPTEREPGKNLAHFRQWLKSMVSMNLCGGLAVFDAWRGIT